MIRAHLRPTITFALAISILVLATTTLAAVVCEQLPTAGGFYSDLKERPGVGFQQEADSFVLAGPTQATMLEWWGSADSDYFDAFYVRFFADDAGAPGEELYAATFSNVLRSADSGYFIYGVALPAIDALKFRAGTVYWVSVAGANAFTGAPDGSEIFYWCTGDVMGYARQLGIEQPWQAMSFEQPAFRLHGEATTPATATAWGTVKALYRR